MSGKLRDVVGDVIGAAARVVLAPRHGESRREALDGLRSFARSGRGARGAFAGTPCAAAGRPPVPAQEAASGGAELAPPAAREGDEHG
jgi:hypothetical protein